jgi:hypothetical protein
MGSARQPLPCDWDHHATTVALRHRRGSVPERVVRVLVRRSLANAIGLRRDERLTGSGLGPVRNRPARLRHCRRLHGIWATGAVVARPIDPSAVGITVSASTRTGTTPGPPTTPREPFVAIPQLQGTGGRILDSLSAGISFRMDSRFRGNDDVRDARVCPATAVIPAKAGIHLERGEAGWMAGSSPAMTVDNWHGQSALWIPAFAGMTSVVAGGLATSSPRPSGERARVRGSRAQVVPAATPHRPAGHPLPRGARVQGWAGSCPHYPGPLNKQGGPTGPPYLITSKIRSRRMPR